MRVYRHGLGDCILVCIKRTPKPDFFLMIDCGVVIGSDSTKLKEAVAQIARETDGRLDALAVTHEHWDHVSGFLQAKEAFEELKDIKEVWLAWTETDDPNDQLADLAKELKEEMGKAKKVLEASAMRFGASSSQASMLEDLAVTQILGASSTQTTAAALAAARKLGAKARFRRPTEKPIEISGANARVYVLGPPPDKKKIRKINPSKSAPETYALAMDGNGFLSKGVMAGLGCFDELDPAQEEPFHRRVTIPETEAHKMCFFQHNYFNSDDEWRRIDGDWLGSSVDVALALQSYTNNTSLVLAIEIGDPGRGEVLLFAADAQVGNWLSWQDYAWKDSTGADLLQRTVFYKVGHHGSHNATLRAEGLEKMRKLRAAVIPVDKETAKKKRWGSMPLPELVEALKERAGEKNVFCTDDIVAKTDEVDVTEEYIQFNF